MRDLSALVQLRERVNWSQDYHTLIWERNPPIRLIARQPLGQYDVVLRLCFALHDPARAQVWVIPAEGEVESVIFYWNAVFGRFTLAADIATYLVFPEQVNGPI